MKHLAQLNTPTHQSKVFTIENSSVWPPATVSVVDKEKNSRVYRLSDSGKIGAVFQYQKGGVETEQTHQIKAAA